MQGEIFVPINQAPGYFISNAGRVYSNKSGRIIKGNTTTKYFRLDLGLGHTPRRFRIHQLVAEAFIGPRPSPKHVCNHKDANKHNNRADNLEWCTLLEDRHHAMRLGLYGDSQSHPSTKLTEEQVRSIRVSYPGVRLFQLAAKYGVHEHTIRKIVKRMTWKNV